MQGIYELGFDQRDLAVFSDTFLQSGMSSIDAFLARRGEHKVGTLTNTTYADIGKAAIACHLILSENPESLHAFHDDHWYQYLWSRMCDSLDSFGENKLRVITFNYDRSLEYYLLTALQNSFGITAQEAATHLQKIPILHVYGQLGHLPELQVDGLHVRDYSSGVSYPAVKAAANGIRVIDESRDDDGIFKKAFSYLRDAQRICFLGFGFDETNMRRLVIDALFQGYKMQNGNDGKPNIYATTLGLQVAERQMIMDRLNVSMYGGDMNPLREVIGSHANLKAEQYLRATGVFIS